MDCRRAEELLSDHLEGALHAILRAELEGHLARCADCRALRQALADVVVALHAAPELEAPSGLAGRAAAAALAQTRERVVRPAIVLPSWVQAAAAGFALVALGTALMVVGPEKPTRAAQRLVGQTVTAGSHLMERRDRIVALMVVGPEKPTRAAQRLVGQTVTTGRRLMEKRDRLVQRRELSRVAKLSAGGPRGAARSSVGPVGADDLLRPALSFALPRAGRGRRLVPRHPVGLHPADRRGALARAQPIRAIENGCYVLAAAQGGTHGISARHSAIRWWSILGAASSPRAAPSPA